LAKLGLVERTDGDGGRCVRLALTPKGEQIAAELNGRGKAIN
jgi:DNA-binding MarR family transcriptional regulator